MKNNKAYLVEEVIEMAIGTLLFALFMGNISIPQFYSVSTSGWDANAILIWGIIPTVAFVAYIMLMFYHVKYHAWPAFTQGFK